MSSAARTASRGCRSGTSPRHRTIGSVVHDVGPRSPRRARRAPPRRGRRARPCRSVSTVYPVRSTKQIGEVAERGGAGRRCRVRPRHGSWNARPVVLAVSSVDRHDRGFHRGDDALPDVGAELQRRRSSMPALRSRPSISDSYTASACAKRRRESACPRNRRSVPASLAPKPVNVRNGSITGASSPRARSPRPVPRTPWPRAGSSRGTAGRSRRR